MERQGILLVDDDLTVLNSLKLLLNREKNIVVYAVNSAEEAVEVVKKEKISLVITDQRMPKMTGVELLIFLKQHYPDIVRILLTGNVDVDVAIEAINEGNVYSFISKPWDPTELKTTLRNALKFYNLIEENKRLMVLLQEQNKELEKSNLLLEEKVRQRTKELEEQIYQILESLSRVLEEKDKYTEGHSLRIEKYALLVAEELGFSEQEKNDLAMAARLHDIGKIGIPEAILNKNSELTEEEIQIIKTHTIRGAKILAPLKQFEKIADIAKKHHERYDGKGYLQCSQQEVSVLSNILIVVDAFDAMTSSRAYRSALSWEDAVKELEKCAGTQFDPKIVDIFIRVIKRLPQK